MSILITGGWSMLLSSMTSVRGSALECPALQFFILILPKSAHQIAWQQ
jgi:hypothetical protein